MQANTKNLEINNTDNKKPLNHKHSLNNKNIFVKEQKQNSAKNIFKKFKI